MESSPAGRCPTSRATLLTIGERSFDVTTRPLVVGILNRTRDSFYDGGAYLDDDAFLAQAERLVAEGADLLEVGARPGGVGVREVTENEEANLLGASVAALHDRFDVPVAVDTWRAVPLSAALIAGATLANDMSGFRDQQYLAAAAEAGATVVATHIRRAPGVPDPDPVYDDVVGEVAEALSQAASRARAAGVHEQRIVVDPGLDLGKTWQQSVRLLAAIDRFAELGCPVLLAASNKIFLGRLLGLDKHERLHATVAACTAGALHGARLLRVHEVAPARQAADLVAALVEETADRTGPRG